MKWLFWFGQADIFCSPSPTINAFILVAPTGSTWTKVPIFLPTFSCVKFLELRLLLVCEELKVSERNAWKHRNVRRFWRRRFSKRADADVCCRFPRYWVETPDGKEERTVTRRSWKNPNTLRVHLGPAQNQVSESSLDLTCYFSHVFPHFFGKIWAFPEILRRFQNQWKATFPERLPTPKKRVLSPVNK